jgi:hypothetical protein
MELAGSGRSGMRAPPGAGGASYGVGCAGAIRSGIREKGILHVGAARGAKG